jgi:hypothetical protein
MGEEYGGFDFSGFDNLDISDLLGGDSGIDFGSLDAGPGGSDLSGLDISALLGLNTPIDFSQILGDSGSSIESELGKALLSTGQASSLFSDDGGFSMTANFRDAVEPDAVKPGLASMGGGLPKWENSPLNPEVRSRDLQQMISAGSDFTFRDQNEGYRPNAGEAESSLKTLASTDKDTSGGKGLKSTGRGQMSAFDPITGATGITGEGFNSVADLLGSGTKEEIARYSPGTADYALRSGLETEGGQGLNADATRGMGLAQMGGGQGLSKYIPAQYLEGSTTPIKGTGGTLSETGFLADSSAANPLGAKYAIGDAKSFINNPTITGQQSVVSPGRTIIDNKDGTYKVVTNTVDGGTKTITTTKDGVDKIIRETKTIDNTKTNQGAKATAANKKDNNMLMMLLALMAMMNKGGGSSTGSGGTIPSLTADRKQLPYGAASGSKARPGAGGTTYFSPTTYTKAAGGGMMYGGGGISDLGGYSDGGRLLRGPGDGVSDSIPATIGGKQPARLAEGEFVVPARIVSELGNGSTEAGAKKLYAMMDRVQNARRKTKNVAANTKAHKYLPA